MMSTRCFNLSAAKGQGRTLNAQSLRKRKVSTNTTNYILWQSTTSVLKIQSYFWHWLSVFKVYMLHSQYKILHKRNYEEH